MLHDAFVGGNTITFPSSFSDQFLFSDNGIFSPKSLIQKWIKLICRLFCCPRISSQVGFYMNMTLNWKKIVAGFCQPPNSQLRMCTQSLFGVKLVSIPFH